MPSNVRELITNDNASSPPESMNQDKTENWPLSSWCSWSRKAKRKSYSLYAPRSSNKFLIFCHSVLFWLGASLRGTNALCEEKSTSNHGLQLCTLSFRQNFFFHKYTESREPTQWATTRTQRRETPRWTSGPCTLSAENTQLFQDKKIFPDSASFCFSIFR